jgi:hypothetical protein
VHRNYKDAGQSICVLHVVFVSTSFNKRGCEQHSTDEVLVEEVITLSVFHYRRHSAWSYTDASNNSDLPHYSRQEASIDLRGSPLLGLSELLCSLPLLLFSALGVLHCCGCLFCAVLNTKAGLQVWRLHLRGCQRNCYCGMFASLYNQRLPKPWHETYEVKATNHNALR